MHEKYNWETLNTLKWMGDEHLSKFQNRWRAIKEGLRTEMPDEVLCQIYYRQVKRSTAIKHDITLFNRMEPDDPNHNLRYLETAVDRHLEEERLEQCQTAQDRQLAAGHLELLDRAPGNAATPVPQKKKQTDKGKGKKGQGRQRERKGLWVPARGQRWKGWRSG